MLSRISTEYSACAGHFLHGLTLCSASAGGRDRRSTVTHVGASLHARPTEGSESCPDIPTLARTEKARLLLRILRPRVRYSTVDLNATCSNGSFVRGDDLCLLLTRARVRAGSEAQCRDREAYTVIPGEQGRESSRTRSRWRSQGTRFSGPVHRGDLDVRVIETRALPETYWVEAVRSGGMAVVYIARRESDLKRYAVKTPLSDLWRSFGTREAAYRRFRWESQVWVTLGTHPNIVQAFRVDEDQFYRPVIILECVDGHPEYGVSLREWLEWHMHAGHRMPLAAVLVTAVGILTGLLHAGGVMRETYETEFVHRDVKPGNVLMSNACMAKVSDFGLVRALSGGGRRSVARPRGAAPRFLSRGACGTPAYMAPEQWAGREVDERTDAYAIGCVLYEMLTGHPRFRGASEAEIRSAHLTARPEPVTGVPADLAALVEMCLVSDRTDRPRLREVREALQAIHERECGTRLQMDDFVTPGAAADWTGWASSFCSLGLHEHAVRCATAAIRMDRTLVAAYNNRAIALRALGDFESALADYHRAVELEPTNSALFTNRGVAYQALNRWEDAISDYERALLLDPKQVKTYNNRGVAYQALGRYDRAVEDYDAAIRLNPSYAAAYNNRGTAYQELGDFDRALHDFDLAIELNPRYAVAYKNRGDVRRSLAEFSAAIEDLTMALCLDPRYAKALVSRGRAHLEMGQLDRARADYEKALHLAAGDAETEAGVRDLGDRLQAVAAGAAERG